LWVSMGEYTDHFKFLIGEEKKDEMVSVFTHTYPQ